MDGALLELFRHQTWATLRLIELCQGLDPSYLEATTPGTYGTIRQTLQHLVSAEEGYYWTVTRERLAEPLTDEPVTLDELAERIRRLGPRWEHLAQDAEAPGRELITRDGWRVIGRVPMAQAVHHADQHRNHVLSILGARGIDVPDLSVWDYAIETGHMQQLEPSSDG
jgi:uncharacterized damage-inducible protein DinB